MKAILLLIYFVIGFLYLYEWGAASNRCSEKRIMLTPFWIFMPNKFNEEGREHLRRARIYIVLALIGLIPLTMVFDS